jgi:hypothetical protein
MKSMEKKDLWGKIKKSVSEGVTVAAEKTEELAKLGSAKLDVLNTRRKLTKKHGELGCLVYTMLKEKKPGADILKTAEVKNLVEALKNLDNEKAEKEKIYEDLRKKTEEDMKEIRTKAKAGMEDLKSMAKSGMEDLRSKAKPVIDKMKEKAGSIEKGRKTEKETKKAEKKK